MADDRNKENRNIQKLHQRLKSKNFEVVLSALKNIKSNYIKDCERIKQLQKSGILKTLISLIKNPKFTNICVSIIADACVQNICLKEIFENNGIEPLIDIIKSSESNDLKNRACRALGNIAKGYKGYAEVLKRDPVSAIVQFLSESGNVECQISGLRTLKILGTDPKTQDLISDGGGLLVVSNFLLSANENILLNSLKTLICLTENYNEKCTRLLLELATLEAIVKLFSHSNDSIQKHVLILVKHLSFHKDKYRRNNLKSVGIIKMCCDIALKNESHEMRETAVLILCSCLDLSHSWRKETDNLQNIVLKTLIDVLNSSLFKDLHKHVIISMEPFFSDDAFKNVFLEFNFIDTLADHLKTFTNNNESAHFVVDPKEYNCSKNRNSYSVLDEEKVRDFLSGKDILRAFGLKADLPPIKLGDTFLSVATSFRPKSNNEPGPSKPKPLDSNDTLESFCGRYESWQDMLADDPMNTVSDHSSSSSESESASASDDCDMGYIFNKSDLYRNPVRKAKRRNQFYVPPAQSAADRVFIQAYDAMFSKKQKIDLEKKETKGRSSKRSTVRRVSHTGEGMSEAEKMGCRIDEHILFMILQLSHFWGNMAHSPLSKNAFFSVLLDYICAVENPHERANLILLAMLRNVQIFEKLIVNGFVDMLDEKMSALHDVRCCLRCSNIEKMKVQIILNYRCVAERDYPRSVLCNMLLVDENPIKLRAIFAICKLIMTKNNLADILYAKNAIQVIFSFLSSESKIEQEKSLICVCEVYKNITSMKKRRIKELYQNIRFVAPSGPEDKAPICSIMRYKHDILFLLEGEKEVSACREKMCRESEYFRALLSGKFLEGKSRLVSLPNISRRALLTILHFIHGCRLQAFCPFFDNIPMDLLLELLGKCEEYLLFSMKPIIEKSLISYFSPDCIVEIYQNAKIYNSPNLCDKVIDYVLTIKSSHQRAPLLKFFREISSPEFLVDLEVFIKDKFY